MALDPLAEFSLPRLSSFRPWTFATQWKTIGIRLNTELVKKPKDLLEYVVVHEMVHLLVPTHSEKFQQLLTRHYPTWREARAELNELPLAAEAWNE